MTLTESDLEQESIQFAYKNLIGCGATKMLKGIEKLRKKYKDDEDFKKIIERSWSVL